MSLHFYVPWEKVWLTKFQTVQQKQQNFCLMFQGTDARSIIDSFLTLYAAKIGMVVLMVIYAIRKFLHEKNNLSRIPYRQGGQKNFRSS